MNSAATKFSKPPASPPNTSLLFLDAAQARARLLTNPWVAEATVLKLYPGRLRIEIKERKAFALWQKDARISLIANDGTVLEPDVPAGFAKLPLVVGEGAGAGVARTSGADRALSGNRAPGRSLGAGRANGAGICICKTASKCCCRNTQPEQALKMLTDLDREKKLLSRDIVIVDLRLADRVTVRQSDAAAAARDEALKAADKNKKKAKGSEA